MSKTKKNTKTTAAKSSRKRKEAAENKPCRAELLAWVDSLNLAFSQLKEKQDALFAAMEKDNDKEVERLKKIVDEAFEKFKWNRRHLPALKFDTISGKYFLRYDGEGNEEFHVSCVKQIGMVVHVYARNERTALVKAKECVARDYEFSHGAPVAYKIVCKRA